MYRDVAGVPAGWPLDFLGRAMTPNRVYFVALRASQGQAMVCRRSREGAGSRRTSQGLAGAPRGLRARETIPDSPLHLFPQSWAAGWSCLSAAATTAEGAERVRVGADRVGVGAGRCCSRNTGAESDSSTDQYFRNHLVVHAFDGSPPNRHSVDILILWGHKAPLCPSRQV
jgi:hypothetical protein